MRHIALTIVGILISITSIAQTGAITGIMSLCTGTSTLLSDTTAGGIWTSSNTAIATIGSSSGIVTGVAAGTVTITYTASSTVTASFTVNALPAPISGPVTLCVGSNVTETDATPGGTWTSSNTAVATIGLTTGVVSGLAGGISSITYSLPTGCAVSNNITVNVTPSPLTGSLNACTGFTTTLSSSPGGGIWTSSLPGVATVSSGGVVTGITAGTTNISYTFVTGCYSAATVSVNPTPSGIGGASSSICSLMTVTYTDGTPGGTWASSNPSVLSINPSTGAATGNSAGSATIFYTVNGCNATRVINVTPLPSVYSVTGGGPYCSGTGGVLVGLSGSQTGVSYQLYYGAALVGTISGTGVSVAFGYQTGAGGYTAIATNPSTGCTSNMSGSATVSINPLPNAYTVTAPDGTSFCTGTTGFHIGLSLSSTGINYEVYHSGTPTGSTLAGTGSALSFGLFTSAGTYTIVATNPITSCNNGMTGSQVVTLNPLPTPYAVSGGGAYCTGSTGPHVTLTNSTVGVNYQLYRGTTAVGGPVTGTGGALDFGAFTTTGTYTVVATNTATSCINNMTGSVVITSNPLPAVYAVTGGGTLCAGSAGYHIYLTGSESGATYQMYAGSTAMGGPVSGTGGGLDFGAQTMAGTYTIIATYPTTGCTRNMSGSAVINVIAAPTPYSLTGGGHYCFGGAGRHVGVANSQSGVDYRLYIGGTPWPSVVHGTGSAIDMGIYTAADTYTVVGTNISTGCVTSMSGSVIISIDPLPTVCMVTGGGSYCSGGTGLHVGLNTSVAGISYQLMYSSGPVGLPLAGSGASLDFGLQTAAGVYNVIATNATTGCQSTMGGSATIAINPLPLTYTVTGGGSYCAGSTGVHIGLGGSNSGISYQLHNGVSSVGSPAGGTGFLLDFGLVTGAGTYNVIATNSSTGCVNTMTGTATVTITATITPTVTHTVSPNDSVCAGTTVTFNATSVSGGLTPFYMWTVNGANVGTGSSYSYIPSNGDIVYVTLTSSLPCALPATSVHTAMTVFPSPVITAPASVCEGTMTTLSGPSGCAWISSNPAVGLMATIGGIPGVFNALHSGTTVITATLSGCSSTKTITVNALPSISASISGPSCGGNFTLNATGGSTYNWFPTTNLSCPTCATTSARPTATTVYTVTGTDLLGCTDTAVINVDGNRISGTISYIGVPTDSFKVWLIQFDASDSSLIAKDSLYTCMVSGVPYFEFYDKPTGNYMVKARLMGAVTGSSGYIPTYGLSTPYWHAASTIVHAAATDTQHINMIYGTVPPGPGFIGGLISSGAGKGTSGAPAPGLLVYLKDAISNFVIASTYTDVNGEYAFSNIGYGSYVIYPEEFSYHTTPSSAITLAPGADSAMGINFREYTTSKVILPITVNAVTNVSPVNGKVNVFPNPTTGVLHMTWDNQAAGTVHVYVADVTGRSVYTNDMHMSRTGEEEIDLTGLKSGVYMLSVRGEQLFYTVKIMVQ